jgi:hypothetical protein
MLVAANGGAFAAEGARAWDGSAGVLVAGNAFGDLAGDAVLLDEAALTLDGNAYDSVAGERLWAQRCSALATVSGEPGTDPACRDAARETWPRLDNLMEVDEVDLD